MVRTCLRCLVAAGPFLAAVYSPLACSSNTPSTGEAPGLEASTGASSTSSSGSGTPARADAGGGMSPEEAGYEAGTSADVGAVPETGGGSRDDSAVVDSSPGADAPASGLHAVLVWGYGEHWPSPLPTATPEPLDVTMKALLEAKGLIVDMMVDKDSTVQNVTGKAVLVISNSVNRANLLDNGQPRFKDIKVPALVTKDGPIEVMGMGGTATGGVGPAGGYSTPVAAPATETSLSIVAPPGEPLAAGLMGVVVVYSPMLQPCPVCPGNMSCCWNQTTKTTQSYDRIIYAYPAPTAKKIATVVGHADQAAIFAYPAGAMMIGGVVAPAKRMGFFIHRDADYGDNGKKLFNAAIDYLLAP
jgi:hypothetical protein